MAISLNDNIKTNAPKPTDDRYLNILVPYADVDEALLIPMWVRYVWLTVNIAGVEYRWKNSTADIDLVEKTSWASGGNSVIRDFAETPTFSELLTTVPPITSITNIVIKWDTWIMTGDVPIVDIGDFSDIAKYIRFVGDPSNMDPVWISGSSILFEDGAWFGSYVPYSDGCNYLTKGTIADTTDREIMTILRNCMCIALDASFGGTWVPGIIGVAPDMNDNRDMFITLDGSVIQNGFGIPFIRNLWLWQINLYLGNKSSLRSDVIDTWPGVMTAGSLGIISVDSGIDELRTQWWYTAWPIWFDYISQAKHVGFDNTVTQLNNNPDNVQKALEELKILIDAAGGSSKYIFSNWWDFDSFYNTYYGEIFDSGIKQDIYLFNADDSFEFNMHWWQQYDLSLFNFVNLYQTRCTIYVYYPWMLPIYGAEGDIEFSNQYNQAVYRHESGANLVVDCKNVTFTSQPGVEFFKVMSQWFEVRWEYYAPDDNLFILHRQYLPILKLDKGYIWENTLYWGFGVEAQLDFNVIQDYAPQITVIGFSDIPVTGNFILTWNGIDSHPLPRNFSEADLQTELQNLFSAPWITVQPWWANNYICTLNGVDFTEGVQIVITATSTLFNEVPKPVDVTFNVTTGKRQNNSLKLLNNVWQWDWTLNCNGENSSLFAYNEPAISVQTFLRWTLLYSFSVPNLMVYDYNGWYAIRLIGLHAVDHVNRYMLSDVQDITGTPTKLIVSTWPEAIVSKVQTDYLWELAINGRWLSKNIRWSIRNVDGNTTLTSFDDYINITGDCTITLPTYTELTNRTFHFKVDEAVFAVGTIADDGGSTMFTLYPGDYLSVYVSDDQIIKLYAKYVPRTVLTDPLDHLNFPITPREIGEQLIYNGGLYYAMWTWVENRVQISTFSI